MNFSRKSEKEIIEEVKKVILEQIPDSEVTIKCRSGHFDIKVISKEFEGKTLLAKQRMVYSAITPFMTGTMPPIHAVDTLETIIPE